MSRESILDVLKRGEVVIADGAFGTMLQAQGLPPGTLPEVWNAEHPDAVLAVHNAYFAAGAQVMTANTLGGNRFRMVEAGLQDRLAELNRQGIRLGWLPTSGRRANCWSLMATYPSPMLKPLTLSRSRSSPKQGPI